MMTDADSRFSLLEVDDTPAAPAPAPTPGHTECKKCEMYFPAHVVHKCPAPAATPAPTPTPAPAPVPPVRSVLRPEGYYPGARVRGAADGIVSEAATLPVDTGAGYQGVRAAQGLVALSVEGKTTGAVMYWHLSGACDLGKLATAWKAQGLDEKILPGTPSETVALSRAAKSQANKHTLVRQHPEGGWVIVHESKTETSLDYTLGLRVRIEKDENGKPKLLATKPQGACDMEEIGRVLREIRAEYDRALTELSSQDVSVWIVRLASWHLQAVALRETGGLYFVPSTHIETFKKMKAAIKAATSHVIYEIPAMHSDEAIAAVLDAIVNETETALVEIQNEVTAKDFGTRGIKSRLNALDEAKEKVIGYSKLLGRDLTDLTKRIGKLRGEVAAVATRGSLLEVD